MSSNYKYIASDLDGTSLQTDLGYLTDKTVESILKYQEKSNNKFFIATGRNITVCDHIAKQLDVKLPVITLNGAVIYDLVKNEIIYQKPIEFNIADAIFKFCIENKFDFVINIADKIIGQNQGERIIFYKKELSNKKDGLADGIITFNTYEDVYSNFIKDKLNVIKFTISIDENDQTSYKKIADFSNKLDIAHAQTYMSNRNLIDMFDKNANKGLAIEYLANNILKIDPTEIIAMGDNNNDFEFIKQSKYGIVPNNAVERVKEVAYKILDKTVKEDGIAYFIDDIIDKNGEI